MKTNTEINTLLNNVCVYNGYYVIPAVVNKRRRDSLNEELRKDDSKEVGTYTSTYSSSGGCGFDFIGYILAAVIFLTGLYVVIFGIGGTIHKAFFKDEYNEKSNKI